MNTHATGSGFFAESVRRPVALLVIFTTLIVVGVISYARIPLQMMPGGMTEPGLWIDVQNVGASAQENEEKVTRILEEQIRTLSGIDSVRSRSSENSVGISVYYENDIDMDLAKAELRDRIERARPLLPDTVDRIWVWSWSNDQMPIMWMAILNPGDSDRTDFLIDTVIKRRIEAVDGVSQVEIFGVLDDSIRILLDESSVIAANLDIGALIQRLSSDNFATPLGEIDDGGRHFLLRADMRFKSLEEIENFPVGDGLRIKDVGRVTRAKSVRNRLSRIDGDYAYFGSVRKESQANIVETSRRLAAALKEIEQAPELDGEFQFVTFFNQGDFIESSLDQLKSTALWGGGFAVLILFMFLRRVRLTLAVALSIPSSALLAIAWTYFTGGTFNVLTMTGITLGVGMLVDNSVVIIENISRLKVLGRSSHQAAVEGTRDVGLAVALATLTSVVVFMPLIFMSENPLMRIIFGAIGMPLCMSLLFSLLVGLVFLPVVAARVVGPRSELVEKIATKLAPLASLPGRGIAGLVGALRYGFHLALVAAHKLQRLTLAIATPLRYLLAAGTVALACWQGMRLARSLEAPAELADLGLAPSGLAVGQALLVIGIGIPAVLVVALCVFGLKRWHARPAAAPARPGRWVPAGGSIIELIVSANRKLLGFTLEHRFLSAIIAILAISSIAIPAGNMQVAAFGQDENRGRLEVDVELESNFTLKEASEEFAIYESWLEGLREELAFEHVSCRFRESSGSLTLWWEESQTEEFVNDARERLKKTQPELAGHKVVYYGEDAADSIRRDIVTFQLEGADADELAQLAAKAKKRLAEIPGLSSIKTPLEDSPEQLRVVFDSDVAYNYGVSADIALQNISWALRGFQLPRYHEEGREVPFIIEYDEERVAGLDTLRDLSVFTGDGAVPLAAFSRLEFAQGARRITRRDGKTTLQITAQIDDPSQQAQLYNKGHAALLAMDFPRGYGVSDTDSVRRRQEDEMGEMKVALYFSIVLVFLLMGILFESFLLPFCVLFTIPYAVVGAFWALYLTGTTMDSVGWIGIIILVGVVVNNGIVLIDRIHRLRIDGTPRTQAVLEGSAHRVRPIMMTALTTICGLLPMALGEPPSQGIDYRALATCVAGGLAFSTFFTLSVVPLAYTVMDDFSRALGRWVRWSFGGLSKLAAGKEESPEVA